MLVTDGEQRTGKAAKYAELCNVSYRATQGGAVGESMIIGSRNAEAETAAQPLVALEYCSCEIVYR